MINVQSIIHYLSNLKDIRVLTIEFKLIFLLSINANVVKSMIFKYKRAKGYSKASN